MRRFVAALAVLGTAVVGFTPTVGAVGYGACTITGTISFATTAMDAGTWTIGPAVLDCQGLIAARRRITGRGPFKGSGTFKAFPAGDAGCMRQSGTGMVDYRIPTSGGDILVTEAESHNLVGAGVFETPTLHGAFQVPPPYQGDCITKPVGRATFVAQVVLVRYPRQAPNPKLPGH